MITFYKLGELGRLGNQLFQYAALRGLGLRNGYEVAIPNPLTKKWHGQTSLLGQFNIEVGFLDDANMPQIKYLYSEPNWKKYDPSFFEIPDFSTIEGFFQSTFYFEGFEDQIKKELTPRSELIKKNIAFIDKIRSENEGFEIVSIHVRRGDNLTNGQTGLIKAFDSGGIYEQYFNNAKKVFESMKVKFLIFTGGQRFNEDNSSDIEWCKKFFIGEEFLFSERQHQIDDFCRIMLCDHNILSHASSFGWWAAYVNPNPNKIIVAPEFYHPDEPGLKREKFYPIEYVLV